MATGNKIQPTNAAVETNHDPEVSTNDSIENEAEGTFADADLNQVTADFVMIGDPTFRAKKIVDVHGVGNKFSGNWYVKKVKHVIAGDGYRIEGTSARNAVGGKHPNAKAATGKKNTQAGPVAKKSGGSGGSTRQARQQPPPIITIDARTGKRV